jgi:small subunit ribosomal protein S16
MVSIRLSRVGRHKAPTYRVIVVPKHNDPWGKVTEILGQYDPRSKDATFKVDAERVKYWLSVGAEASDTVWNLLVSNKIVEGKKRNTTHLSKERKASIEEKNKKAEPAAEAAPQA